MANTTVSLIAKHIRNRIKAAGINARVKCGQSCGSEVVTVVVPAYDVRFTAQEIANFCDIAKTNRLTFVRGVEIDPAREAGLVGKIQWNFYVPADVIDYWTRTYGEVA